jgi:hypothetical protein
MTVTITEQLRDASGQPDNTQWVFHSPLRESTPPGTVITVDPVTATQVNGVLSIQLEPGPMVAKYRGAEYYFTVPTEDSELWPLISPAVQVPPGTPYDTLTAAVETAVDNYMATNPIDRCRYTSTC